MLRQASLLACAIVIAVVAGAHGWAADPAPEPAVLAGPAVLAPAVLADNGTCASACQSRHDHCRVATRGGPDCDSARQRCLQACLESRKSR